MEKLRGKPVGTKRWAHLKSGVIAGVLAVSLSAAGCGATSVGSTKVVPESGSPRPLTVAEATYWSPSWSYNPFSPNAAYDDLADLVVLPLAVQRPPKFDTYIPELASSWSTSSSRIVIHLRKSARWQNGRPVTAADLLTTLLLEGADASPIWTEITSATAPSSRTLNLMLRAHVPPSLVLNNVLTIVPVPTAQYGRFVPSGFEKTLLQANAANPPTSATTKVADVGKEVSDFSPKRLLANGPFTLTRMTTFEAEMHRSSRFWARRSVHVPSLVILNTSSNSANSADLEGDRADFAPQNAMPYPIWRHWLDQGGHYVHLSEMYAEIYLVFNDKTYPFDLQQVRQALAYIVNRPRSAALGNSGKSPFRASPYPDGLSPALAAVYGLTSSRLASLNRYSPNPTKAAALLRGAGLHKRGSQWFLPNGKPFKTSIQSPSQYGTILVQDEAIASELSAFGIETKTDALEATTVTSDVQKGTFQIAWGGNSAPSLDPLTPLDAVLGPSKNYGGPGATGIGFGPSETVPGLGKVAVSQTIQSEYDNSGPSEWPALVWDWAKLVDTAVPYIPLEEKYSQIEYSSATYTDWPAATSPLWNLESLNNAATLLVGMERGYIRPR